MASGRRRQGGCTCVSVFGGCWRGRAGQCGCPAWPGLCCAGRAPGDIICSRWPRTARKPASTAAGSDCRCHLSEQDRDRACGWGDVRRRSGAADPAVTAWQIPRVDGRDVDRPAESPPLALEEQLADLALGWGGVVAGHQPYRIGGQQPPAVGGGAFGQQHPAEGKPVIGGSGQPAIAQREWGRVLHCPSGPSASSSPPAGVAR